VGWLGFLERPWYLFAVSLFTNQLFFIMLYTVAIYQTGSTSLPLGLAHLLTGNLFQDAPKGGTRQYLVFKSR